MASMTSIRMFSRRRKKGCFKALANELLPTSCSSSISLTPRSTRNVAHVLKACATTAAKTMGQAEMAILMGVRMMLQPEDADLPSMQAIAMARPASMISLPAFRARGMLRYGVSYRRREAAR